VSHPLRFAALAAVASLSTFALSGCGGSPALPNAGGAQALGNRQSQSSSSSNRTNPPVTNPYPFTEGDVFNYAYNDTLTTTTSGSPVKSYVSGTVALTIGPVETFDGQQLTQLTEVYAYTDSDSSHKTTATGTLTTEYYREFQPVNGGLDYVTFGNTTSGNESDTDGTSIVSSTSLTYDAAFLLDVIPEVKSSWADEIPNSQSGSTATTTSGSTETINYTFTRNSDLSYSRDTSVYLNNVYACGATDAEAKDGSGSEDNTCSKSASAGDAVFSAPAKSGGKYFIKVVFTPLSGSPTTTEVPDWFPGGGAVKKLVTDTTKDKGAVKVPKDCGKAVAGQSAVELDESSSYLDAILGTYDVAAASTYVVSGEGIVCVARKYTNNTYDNRVTGALTTSVASSSVSGLTSESLQNLRAKHLVAGFPQGRSR
jgi:hypothetical protein